MKKVFTAPSIIPCDFLRSLLDSAGIESTIKNEWGSSGVGKGAPVPYAQELPWASPEVWVNDEDFEAASEIAADFWRKHTEGGKRATAPPSDESHSRRVPSEDVRAMYTCTACHALIDADASVCPNCGRELY